MNIPSWILGIVVGLVLAVSATSIVWGNSLKASDEKPIDEQVTDNRVHCYREDPSHGDGFPICCASATQHRCFTEPILAAMVDLYIRENLSDARLDLVDKQIRVLEEVYNLLKEREK